MKFVLIFIFFLCACSSTGRAPKSDPALMDEQIQKSISLLLGKGKKYLHQNPSIYQDIATQYSFLGDEKMALKYMEEFQVISGYIKNEKEAQLNKGITFKPAIIHLTKVSKKYDIVMLNEAHHISRHRVFTQKLLKHFWSNGYRSLGLEALLPLDNQDINSNKIVSRGEYGVYLKDPQFIKMINEALDLGYYVFGYESVPDCDPFSNSTFHCQNLREKGQADNIIKFINSKKAPGKILIHAGYGHIAKTGSNGWVPMGEYLMKYSNKKILTVDQVDLFQACNPEYDHPLYKSLNKKFNPNEEVIFFQNYQPLLTQGSQEIYDLQVFSPRTF